jgi:methylase of polypeptide subunit release factors
LVFLQREGLLRFNRRILMRGNALIRKCVFCSPRFAGRFFGIRFSASPGLQSYCEWPTILQRMVIGKYMRADSNVLELGTGAHAILAIYIQRRWPGAKVIATDVVPERVRCAQRTIAANGVAVRCIESDLFQKVEGRYDLILFSPPQTPTSVLAALGYQPVSVGGANTRLCWSSDGGEDGMAVIYPFLAGCSPFLAHSGWVLMAINPVYVDLTRLHDLVLQAGLRITRVHRLPLITSVYALSIAGFAGQASDRKLAGATASGSEERQVS